MNQDYYVNKLISLTGVSDSEAKYVLEQNDYDILDSLLFMQNNSRISDSKVIIFNTQNYKPDVSETSEYNEQKVKRPMNKTFLTEFNSIIHKLTENYLFIYISNSDPIKIQIAWLVILLILGFGIFVPLLFIGLLFDVKYKFKGIDIKENDQINVFLNKISNSISNHKKRR